MKLLYKVSNFKFKKFIYLKLMIFCRLEVRER